MQYLMFNYAEASMYILSKIAALIGFSCGVLYSFDQMPTELLIKIIFIEPSALVALSETSSAMHKKLISWAQERDKSFLTIAYWYDAPQAVRFILRHSKKVNDIEASKFAHDCWQSPSFSLFLKSISGVRPWAVLRSIYATKEHNRCIDRDYIEKMVENGFLIPMYYCSEKATPTLHALIGQCLLLPALKATFEKLLRSGMNPSYEHNGKTIFDLIEEDPKSSLKYKNKFRELCLNYVRDPIDPTVVMYLDPIGATVQLADRECFLSV
jgi:hypothetical protein